MPGLYNNPVQSKKDRIVYSSLLLYVALLFFPGCSAPGLYTVKRFASCRAKDSAGKPIIITAVGDLIFHGPVLKGSFNPGTKTYDFRPVFQHIKKYIKAADFAVANLETVTAGKKYPYIGYPRFNTPASVLKDLRDTGFDLLFTANNHIYDRGLQGLARTISNIGHAGLYQAGAGLKNKSRMCIVNIRGVKIAFLAYTYNCNGFSRSDRLRLSGNINFINRRRIRADIQKARASGAVFILVSVHWGYQYMQNHFSGQAQWARKILRWGADIVLGSHPHVIQAARLFRHGNRNKYVIYSMGNFISNMRMDTVGHRLTEDGVIVNLHLRKQPEGRVYLERVSYVPTWVYRYKKGSVFKYRILPAAGYRGKVPEKIRKRLRCSFRDTRTRLGKPADLK